MKITRYSSLSEPDVESHWKSYFKTPTIFGDYDLACHIEKSLFDYGIDKVEVLIFTEDNVVKGILPISHEITNNLWSYYPSYIFISVKVTIDDDCWKHLYLNVPTPFRIHETSFKTSIQIPLITLNPANVINLTSHVLDTDPFNSYLASLDKKTRSKFRNCLNRNQDIEVIISHEKDVEGGDIVIKNYMDYCTRFEEGEEFSYFQNQLAIFPKLFEVATRLGELIILQLRLDGELVALNYSLLENGCLYDYICYRDVSEELDKRSLGIFAILKNIEYVLRYKQELYYDLASEFSYKRQFIPDHSEHYKQITLHFA